MKKILGSVTVIEPHIMIRTYGKTGYIISGLSETYTCNDIWLGEDLVPQPQFYQLQILFTSEGYICVLSGVAESNPSGGKFGQDISDFFDPE